MNTSQSITTDLQEFLTGNADYFYCERERCTMRKSLCREHYEQAQTKAGDPWILGVQISAGAAARANCIGCEQGREIGEEVTSDRPSAGSGLVTSDKRPPALRKHGAMEGREENAMKKGICEGCHQEKELIARGFCKNCYVIWRRDELKKAGGKKLQDVGLSRITWKKKAGRPEGAAPVETAPNPPDPFERQVGGDHYKQYKIQPYEFFFVNRIPHHKAAVIRRILRYDHPTGNGLEDLKKIIHEVEMIMKLEAAAK